MKRRPAWAMAALLLTAASAGAQLHAADASEKAEHARIAAERARINARFAAEEKACHQRFAVNDCLKANRRWQRAELDDLRRQEIVLNDAERQRKAAEQLEKLDDKQRARASEPAPQADAPAPAPKAAPSPHGGRLPREAAPRTPDQARIEQHEESMRRKQAQHALDEARRAAQAAKAPAEEQRNADRLREAAEYKARVLEREARKPSKAAPLPVPGAAATP